MSRIKLDKRVDISEEQTKDAVANVKALQFDINIMKLYRDLKVESKVRWKDSIKAVVKRRMMQLPYLPYLELEKARDMAVANPHE